MQICRIATLFGALIAAASSAAAQTSPIPDARLDEARALLESSDIGTHYIGASHAVLAVWRVGSEEPVRTINVWRGLSKDPAFIVRPVRGGGVGTVYTVTDPPGYEVLALRMNVRDYERKPWYKPVTTITVTDTLVSDARVARGKKYLEALVAAAQLHMAECDERSCIPGHRDAIVGHMVSETTLMSLPVVERIAPEVTDGTDPETAIRRTLTAFAVNGEDAFDLAKSPVGARGMFQFMPSTYRSMRQACRRAKLDRNFIRGTRDHLNAATAAVCLTDSILGTLDRKNLRRFLAASDEERGAYIAAEYNGGPVYTKRALRRHPDAWDAEHSWRIDRKRPGLLRPTVHYVRVFRTVYRFLEQRTPS